MGMEKHAHAAFAPQPNRVGWRSFGAALACAAALLCRVVVGASEHLGHRIVGSLASRLVRAGKWPVTVVP